MGGEPPPLPPRVLTNARYRRILRFALRYMVQEWWFGIALPRMGLAELGRRGRPARFQRIARRFRVLAIELGGLMIKVGQFLSSRMDVLPPEITRELESLQDEVPPVPFAQIRDLAEAELRMPLERAYAAVDPIPVAAASLGQVHRARLVDEDAAQAGLTAVVVKIQRPGIDRIIDIDLAAIRRVAGWLGRLSFIARRVDLPALVEEFAATTREEIDYLHEAASAERFAAAFADDGRVDAPAPVWELVTRRVLTLADVTATKVNDLDALRAAGIDPHEVAATLADVMFQQLFTDGFFHADPHPGNIFVTPHPGAGRPWTLTFVDFGMMGEVPDALRHGMQHLLVAAAERSGKGLVAAIDEMGVLLPAADRVELERAMTELFARFGGMGIAELQRVDPAQLRDFGDRFGRVLREHPFQLPEDFLFLIRAVSVTSGVCSSLDPRFNMWDALDPYAQQLVREHAPDAAAAVLGTLLNTVRGLAALPKTVDAMASAADHDRARARHEADEQARRLERTGRRVVSAVLFAGLFLGGILLRPAAEAAGIVLMAVSALPFLHAVFAGLHRR